MKKTILLLIVILTISQVFAKDISLKESIRLAKEQNKDLLSEKNSLASAKWGEKNAFTNFLPKVTFNSTMVRLDNDTYKEASEVMQIPVFGPDGIPNGNYIPFSGAEMSGGIYKTSFNNGITVQQPIFNGGKIILGYQLSKLAKEQAIFSLQNKENDITFQVASTYFNILKIQDVLMLSQKSVESSKAHLKKVRDNYRAGTAKKTDVLQWEVKLQNDETALNEVKNNLNVLLTVWKNLLGTDDELYYPQKINVENFDAEIEKYALIKNEQLEKEVEKILNETEKSNPVLKTLSTTDKMMDKQLLMAKGNFLPSLNLQFSYQIENDDKFDFSGEDNWNLVAAFSFPLFSSGANFTNMKKTKYDVKKTKLTLESTKDNILVGAKNTFCNLVTKAQTVENNKSALAFAKENHKLINNFFEQGMITNSDLMDADIMLFANEMNLVSSYYDFLISKYELIKFTNEKE